MLLGQHCTGQKPMQCCPRGSTKYWTGNDPVQYCLNILGTTLHRSKLYGMLSERLQTTLDEKKSGEILS